MKPSKSSSSRPRVGAVAASARRPSWSTALAALLCLVLAALVAGCGSGGDEGSSGDAAPAGSASENVAFQPEGEPVRGGVLTVSRALRPTTFTPWVGNSNAELMIQMQVFSPLLEATPDFTKLRPGLADSWEISADGLRYDFHVRPGVKFSDGTPLTSEDIKYSLDTLRDPIRSPNRAPLLVAIESISTPDPEHVVVHLKEPQTAFLEYLILMPIVSKAAVEEMGDEAFGFKPVGTGPFMVRSYSPGSNTLELDRNPHFWREGRPYLDGVTFKFIEDDNARMLAVESGQIDVADSVPFSQLDRIENAPGVDLVRFDAFAADQILVNNDAPPLNKVAVRQALVYATPLEQLAAVAFHGVAPVAATGNFPTKYLDRSIEPYPFDVEKARELLKQAGESDLSLTLTIVSGDAVGKQVATIIQSAWKEAGIDLAIRQKDHETVINDWIEGNYELVNTLPFDQTSDVAVDDELDQFWVTPPEENAYPWTGWDNPEARRLVREAARSSDEALRRRNFSEYQQILHEEQPVIGLVYPPNLFAVRSDVHNLVAVGEGWPLLEQVWLAG